MPLLRINATDTGPTLHDRPERFERHIRRMAADTGPAIIMVHGYKYAPHSRAHCPHRKLYRNAPDGWPQELGFGAGQPAEGLGIALGWYARGPLHKVHHRAVGMGQTVACIVQRLRRQRPSRPVHIIAHSLGAEAALSALEHLPRGALDRMVLLTGAAYRSRASEMLATPAGRTVEVLNVVSRENDLFDAMFEGLVRAPRLGDKAIGQGMTGANVVNLQIDCTESLHALTRFGHAVAPPARRVCHWSGYTRSGLMPFYNSFLREPARMPLTAISAALPCELAPRWSRLTALPRFAAARTQGLNAPA